MNRLGDTSAFANPAGQLLLTRRGKTRMDTVGIVFELYKPLFKETLVSHNPSTQLALVQCTHKSQTTLHPTIALFIVLSPPRQLIMLRPWSASFTTKKKKTSKLNSIGINNWIKAFLSDRVQQICINGSNSTWKPVTSGILQGSVL